MIVHPKIIVITVVINDPCGLRRTINSVNEQTYEDCKQIVIDGGSTDDETIALIKQYEDTFVYCVSESDAGIYDAMNKAMRYASDDSYIVFMNAGDTFAASSAVENVIKRLSPSTDAFYGDIYVRGEGGALIMHQAKSFDLDTLLRYGTGAVCHQAFFIKRSLAPKYDIRYTYKAELNWYFDILQANSHIKIQHIPEPVVIFQKGGLGYQHFIRNRIEWIRVIKNRFGWRTVAQYDLILYLLKNAKYRYSWLERVPLHLQLFKSVNFIFNTAVSVLAILRK